MKELSRQVDALMQIGHDRCANLESALRTTLGAFAAETGTIHLLDAETRMLHLVAQIGLPPPVLEIVRQVPVGKGIAGQTAARGEAVTVCNLQKDDGGVARPGARQTGVGGALCVPLRNGTVIVGTLGVGTIREYEYTADETQILEEVGRVIGNHLAASYRPPSQG